MIIKEKEKIVGTIKMPGDKSISHRAILIASLIEGMTKIEHLSSAHDVITTLKCMRKLGIKIDTDNKSRIVVVHGITLRKFKKPDEPLNCENSGTTMRMLSGILAGASFDTVLTGDESLCKRPMERVIEPLTQMGAEIYSQIGCAPLCIKGKKILSGIYYNNYLSSAQVKSSILLASLNSKGVTTIEEKIKSRDHTEKMLGYLGAGIKKSKNIIIIKGKTNLLNRPITIPGDFSSAAYFIVAALLLKNSQITIEGVGINKTRIGMLTVLIKMGASIRLLNRRSICGEDVADITASTSNLQATTIEGSIIPKLIDELPIIAVAALYARGKTVIKNAQELKYKESDRINCLAIELNKMGSCVCATNDGMVIQGRQKLRGTKLDCYNDHRLAMALSIAAICAEGESEIAGSECVRYSYPTFFETLDSVTY